MKQKFKTVVFSLFVALLGGAFFTSCDQDSFGIKAENNYLSAQVYASKLVKTTVELHKDLFTRNQQIFTLPNRFSNEIDRLGKVTTLQDLEELLNTTDLDLDLSKLQAKIQLLEEVAEALAKKAFTEEDITKEISLQSRNQDWTPPHQLLLRGKMDCLRSYDRTARNILIGEMACVGVTIVKTGGIASSACAIIALSQLMQANDTLQACLEEAEK